METEEKQDMGGVIIGLVSFCSSIISIFVMYYIFAALSLMSLHIITSSGIKTAVL